MALIFHIKSLAFRVSGGRDLAVLSHVRTFASHVYSGGIVALISHNKTKQVFSISPGGYEAALISSLVDGPCDGGEFGQWVSTGGLIHRSLGTSLALDDVCTTGRLLHDIKVSRSKGKSSGGETLSNQVSPERLDWDKGIWETKSSSKETVDKIPSILFTGENSSLDSSSISNSFIRINPLAWFLSIEELLPQGLDPVISQVGILKITSTEFKQAGKHVGTEMHGLTAANYALYKFLPPTMEPGLALTSPWTES